MSTLGVYPLDPDTPVGEFRLLSGDSEGTPIEPPTPPVEANYAIWSDAEIEAFLAISRGSVARAISIGYSHLMAQSSSTEQIRTDDLNITSKELAKWQAMVDLWASIADQEDQRDVDDFAEIYDTRGINAPAKCWPEASPRPWL